MTFQYLTLEHTGAVSVVRLNRPERLNALSPDLIQELGAAIREVLRLGTSRAILLAAAGRSFCSGVDLQAPRRDVGADTESTIRDLFNITALMLRECPLPTVAAVQGAAAGAGCSLALLCDFVVAADSAYFLQAFSNIGLVPDTGSSWLVTRLVGPARATELMMLGDRLPAATAAQWGLIHRAVPDEQLEAESLALAERLAARPTLSLKYIKRLVRHASTSSLRDQMLMEQEYQALMRNTEDAAEARAAFKEKRQPMFKGR
jgi:2-(1,2-epoxy-1,2-dihydrophenyl)acetyl-CoA isomerase